MVTKADIVSHVKETHGGTKAEAEAAVDSVFSFITKSLHEGTEVRVHGFGTFKIATRAARIGRNPRTGDKLEIAESKTVSFKGASALTENLK